ncbi:MAG: glycosyltransferase family 2 protein [Gammaproteobacteria bacterium]|nr:MAG: glycosyltransferase family 2 protein [Gammaproteobacteria bacterium]
MADIVSFKPCVLVPVYNHHQRLAEGIEKIRQYDLPVIMVDDGSNDICKSVMRDIAANDAQVRLVERAENGGKGAALKTGFRTALELGFSHALQIDADGQHNILDIPRFLEISQASPNTLIAGKPEYDESVPKGRFYGRYLTHVWVWINTLSLDVKDSMCGFRVYPVRRSCELIAAESMGNRMDFDSEFMVRWHWRHWPLLQLSTRVIYPEQGVSHFHAWRDNKLISWMHTRLFFGMLWRFPRLMANKFRAEAK